MEDQAGTPAQLPDPGGGPAVVVVVEGTVVVGGFEVDVGGALVGTVTGCEVVPPLPFWRSAFLRARSMRPFTAIEHASASGHETRIGGS